MFQTSGRKWWQRRCRAEQSLCEKGSTLWLLILNTSGGYHQNLGLGRLKSLCTDCCGNLQFWGGMEWGVWGGRGLGGGPPAVSAFVQMSACIGGGLHTMSLLYRTSVRHQHYVNIWCDASTAVRWLVAKVAVIWWCDWPENAFFLELRGTGAIQTAPLSRTAAPGTGFLEKEAAKYINAFT